MGCAGPVSVQQHLEIWGQRHQATLSEVQAKCGKDDSKHYWTTYSGRFGDVVLLQQALAVKEGVEVNMMLSETNFRLVELHGKLQLPDTFGGKFTAVVQHHGIFRAEEVNTAQLHAGPCSKADAVRIENAYIAQKADLLRVLRRRCGYEYEWDGRQCLHFMLCTIAQRYGGWSQTRLCMSKFYCQEHACPMHCVCLDVQTCVPKSIDGIHP